VKRLDSIFDGLDERETAYVLARSECVSNSEALRRCGKSEGWLYKRDIDDLNNRADELRKNKAIRASMILAEAVEEAAKVKTSGLKARDERIKQAVATEIIERELGKIPVKSEVTGADGDALEIIVRYAENNRTDSA
jgi:vacuolar-type H+-ATPase subunit H